MTTRERLSRASHARRRRLVISSAEFSTSGTRRQCKYLSGTDSALRGVSLLTFISRAVSKARLVDSQRRYAIDPRAGSNLVTLPKGKRRRWLRTSEMASSQAAGSRSPTRSSVRLATWDTNGFASRHSDSKSISQPAACQQTSRVVSNSSQGVDSPCMRLDPSRGYIQYGS